MYQYRDNIHCQTCEDCYKPVPNGVCPDPACPFHAEIVFNHYLNAGATPMEAHALETLNNLFPDPYDNPMVRILAYRYMAGVAEAQV